MLFNRQSEQRGRQLFSGSLARTDWEVASISPNSRFIPAMEGCLRAVEPLKAHPHFVLLFTIFSFRTLQDLHGVTLAILMERLLRHREPVYSLAPSSTGAYKQSLHFHAHIRAIKNKSNADWYKPFVKLALPGNFWNPLCQMEKKNGKGKYFWECQSVKINTQGDFQGSVAEAIQSVSHGFHLFFSGDTHLYIFTQYDTIPSILRMLICTSINSYLKDKSKHVCFLFVCYFFSSTQLPKGIYEHFGNKAQRRI